MIKWLLALFKPEASPKVAGPTLVLPEHERPLGHFFHESYGTPFEPFRSFEEARNNDSSYVILQGDWGGQVYVVAPMCMVKCSERSLKNLLKVIDDEQWSCNEGDGAEIFYERLIPPGPVAGGMGGGVATQDIWVHPKICAETAEYIKHRLAKNDEDA